jgi:DNA-binding HxlR family transcriptional regulator
MRRSYRQFCGVARALDVVGERWTLLIVRNLLLGPKRYSDLLAELPGITTNLLAARLAQLDKAGLVERGWRLTEAGAALEPVVMELGRFGGRYLDAPKKTDTVNAGWALLSLKRRYLGGERGVLGVKVAAEQFELAFEPARLKVQQVPAVRPDATLTAESTAVLGQLFVRGVPPAQLLRSGALALGGDEAAAWRLLSSLGVSPPARRR